MMTENTAAQQEQREGLVARVNIKWSESIRLVPGDELHIRLMGITDRQLINLINRKRIGWGVVRRTYARVMVEAQQAQVVTPESRIPEHFLIKGRDPISRSELAWQAFQRSGLTPETWRDMPADEREELIWARLDDIRKEFLMVERAMEQAEKVIVLAMAKDAEAVHMENTEEAEETDAPEEPPETPGMSSDSDAVQAVMPEYRLECKSGWWRVRLGDETISGPLRKKDLEIALEKQGLSHLSHLLDE